MKAPLTLLVATLGIGFAFAACAHKKPPVTDPTEAAFPPIRSGAGGLGYRAASFSIAPS